MQKEKRDERRAVLAHRGARTLLGSTLLSLAFTLLLGGASLLLCAFLLTRTPSLGGYMGAIGGGLGAVWAFLGGIFAGKRHRLSGALAGALFGMLYILLVLLAGHYLSGDAPIFKRLLGCALFLLLSTLGGVLGTLRIGKAHKRKRRR